MPSANTTPWQLEAIAKAIDGLPDTLAADDSNWALVYDYEGKPAWIWPHGQIPPSRLSTSTGGGHRGVGVSFGFNLTGAAAVNAPALRARAGSRRGQRGRPVLQKPALGAANGERRCRPGVRGVLLAVPEASMSAAGDEPHRARLGQGALMAAQGRPEVRGGRPPRTSEHATMVTPFGLRRKRVPKRNHRTRAVPVPPSFFRRTRSRTSSRYQKPRRQRGAKARHWDHARRLRSQAVEHDAVKTGRPAISA